MGALSIEEEEFFNLFNAPSMKKAYEKIPWEEKKHDENEIVALLKPTKVDWRLRIRLWELVEKALDQTNEYNKIYTVDIVEGICGSDIIYGKLRDKRYFASFFFSPIEKFTDEVDTMLNITRNKMWQLINNLKPVKKDGTVDRAHAQLLIKIHKELVDRKMGAAKQMIEMKKIQLNLNQDLPITDDIELLDAKIRELKPSVEIKPRKIEVTESEEGACS